jgi:phosphoribosylamine--glycine ligase
MVIEEFLDGEEASLFALVDGETAVPLASAQDHKRVGEGDTGPNTGGMGAYSPVPDLPDAAADDLIDRFHRPILAELARRGTPFRGALYAGLMLTAEGPVLLECNARFGDPETQAILPRLAVPLGPLLLAAAGGRLLEAARPLGLAGARLPVLPIATVGIVLAAAGYPDAPRRDDAIEGLDRARAAGALVFHGGTARDDAGSYRTAGGRILTVVGRGPDVAVARAEAEAAVDLVAFHGVQRRHDIGADAVPLEAAR